ncbi:hypothetical protein AMTR_s00157p00036250 [Amborella trichopoda]|uniref:Uncharacterized protein n=1 Tax=Amborella trichopoda TaxID=13333 RepID=W1PKD6_AMBTC|nr:hypothetical protein AMTR_s00157p00036250 [Amborella trichopoda]
MLLISSFLCTGKAVGLIHAQLGQKEKALDIFRKATRIDSRDAQAFFELGELLVSSDTGAALDALKTVEFHLTEAIVEIIVFVENPFLVAAYMMISKASFVSKFLQRSFLCEGIWGFDGYIRGEVYKAMVAMKLKFLKEFGALIGISVSFGTCVWSQWVCEVVGFEEWRGGLGMDRAWFSEEWEVWGYNE